MNTTSLACLLIATPTLAFGDPADAKSWLGGELAAHWGDPQQAETNPAGPRSWAVARVIAGDPLLQTRPIVRDQENSLEHEIIRDMTHCTIAAHRHFAERSSHRPVVACRFPQWAGICVADGMTERWSQHPAERDALKSDLPDFLLRELPGKRAEALLFFAALGACFHQGHLSPLRCEPTDILGALTAFEQKLCELSGGTHDTSLWLTEGRMLYVLHSGTPLTMRLGPKPDRAAQHTLRHKASEGAPSVLVTTTHTSREDERHGQAVEAKVFAVDSHRPTELLTL